MKVAVIGNWQALRIIRFAELGYHMALGQHLVRDPAYRGRYVRFGRLGHFIMVDNGTAERDVLPFAEVVQAAREVCASEVVLPDRRRDWRGTMNAIYDNDNEALRLLPRHMRAVCPQGDTFTEWAGCLQEMIESFGFATICIAKNVTYTPGGRPAALRYIVDNRFHERYNVHLLGCVNERPIGELKECMEVYPGIRGVDTAAPLAYAQDRIKLEDGVGHHSYRWEGTIAPKDQELAEANIETLVASVFRRHKDYKGLEFLFR